MGMLEEKGQERKRDQNVKEAQSRLACHAQSSYYRVIQVTVFFNFSLTGTKKVKNGKTQPFLFSIYVDILIF